MPHGGYRRSSLNGFGDNRSFLGISPFGDIMRRLVGVGHEKA